jgi:hypothetical protein
MTKPLLISGTLGHKATARFLAGGQSKHATVIEWDSLFDRDAYPSVGIWHNMTDFMDASMIDQVNGTIRSWSRMLFDHPMESRDVMVGRHFRLASFGVSELVCLTAAAMNQEIGRKILSAGSFSQIRIAVGGGVNPAIWKELALEHSLPLEIFPVEKHLWNPIRRISKWRNKSRQKAAAGPRLDGTPIRNLMESPDILCASRLVGEILLKDGGSRGAGLAIIASADLSRAAASDIAPYQDGYAKWWEASVGELFESKEGSVVSPAVRRIIGRIGASQAKEVYPLHACIYERARTTLERIRPKSLLCDTQRGGAERMWSLAARDLGIPVIAYTFDHLLDPDYFFTADYLISDSGRNTLNGLKKGVPEANVIEAASHRHPPQRITKRKHGKIVVCADNFYSGDQCTQDPQISYRLYRAAVTAAREMPEVEFVLKFHPLRQRKSELRSYIGMDEQELANRKRYIRSLIPPSNFRTLDPEANLLALLQTADALINIESLTGVEAFRYEIPVIFLRPPIAQDFPLLADYEASVHPTPSEGLASSLRKILYDADARNRQISNQNRYINEFYWRSGTSIPAAARQLLQSIPMTRSK